MISMQQRSASLLEKMKSSGRYTPISDDEYKRLQRLQNEKLEQAEKQTYRPDLSRLGLAEIELSLTWEQINPKVGEGYKVLNAVKPAYQKGHGMVYLYGAWGQGKTLIGKILAATAHRDGKRAAYANVSNMLDDIRKAFDEKEAKTTELIRRMDFYINRDVLFLDELDKSNETPWAQERLFQLLDQRYTRALREEALTVIASNRADGELDGYLRSRLNDSRLGPIVKLDGVDVRRFMQDGMKI